MILQKSIVIIGEICSGKSTLARLLSEEVHFPKVSFGEYLAHFYHNSHAVDGNRTILQNLGQEMIKNDPIEFLKCVVEFFAPSKNEIIFDGVRHEVIFEEIRKISLKVISIYIEASYQQRLSRYLIREKVSDFMKTEVDFLEANLHPVEKEVRLLKDQCSFIIHSSFSAENDFIKLKNGLVTFSGVPAGL